MARTIDSARRVISGTWGELWIDGEKVAEVSACQAKVALNKETVNLCGRFMTTHKAMNASGTGSLTMHKVDSGFAQRMEGIKRGAPALHGDPAADRTAAARSGWHSTTSASTT